MSRQATRNTGPEMRLRRLLHHRGLRYLVHRRPLPDLRREADIVFPAARVAVFVDGCFWHGCDDHGTAPQRNASFWTDKIERNRIRDAETDASLRSQGWTSIRVWEHELVDEAADRIAVAVAAARAVVRPRAP